jgi:GNAT superfamily N-acetyltransferase
LKIEIVPATEATMAEVEAWLDAEEAAHKAGNEAWERGDYSVEIPQRGFRCNWNETKRRWREDEAPIDILMVDGEAVGFQGQGLFEIRPDLRGRGYGRILAEHMIASRFNEGSSVIEIGIAPLTAVPFWESMGFTRVPGKDHFGSGAYAYLVLPRTFELGDGESVPYRISFFSTGERYSDCPKACAVFEGSAERLSHGGLQLPERAICFDPEEKGLSDPFVRIEMDGKELHFDKAKYDSSKALGVKRDQDGRYFLDRIELAAS